MNIRCLLLNIKVKSRRHTSIDDIINLKVMPHNYTSKTMNDKKDFKLLHEVSEEDLIYIIETFEKQRTPLNINYME